MIEVRGNSVLRNTMIPIAVIAAVVCLAPAAASAATITPTPGFFADDFTENANCSLREAIEVANDDAGGGPEDSCVVNGTLGDDTVNLEAGPYILDIAGSGGDTNINGDLDVNPTGTSGDLTIDGAGATATTIDTDDAPAWDDRVLHHVAGTGVLTVSDLTVSGGNISSSDGGGIYSTSGTLALQGARVTGNAAVSGGGVFSGSGAVLSILNSSIDTNTTIGPNGGGGVFTAGAVAIDSSVIRSNEADADPPRGGGIVVNGSTGTRTITNSVIAANKAQSTGTFAAAGGGISIQNGTVTVTGTTIMGNKVLGGSARIAGGVFVAGATTILTLVNSTVSGNEVLLSGGSGGGLRVSSATAVANVISTTFGPNPSAAAPSGIQNFGIANVRGTVIEDAGAATACGGSQAITSQGDNVFADTSCGTGGTGDEASADPQLGTLQDNGGPDAGSPGFLEPILTHLPAQNSTAVDHVPAADCDDETLGAPLLLVDQRGLSRPSDGDESGVADCDAGSVELQAAPPPPPPATTTPPATGGGQPPTTTPVAKKKCKKAKRAVAAKKKCKKRK